MSQNKTAWDLVYLVSCVINDEKLCEERCADMDLTEVFSLARGHSLTVIAATAIEKFTSLPSNFKEEKFKVIRRLSLFDIERNKVFEAFEKSGIWYLPLKGIVIRNYYPKTLMREMSDNDILCDSEKASEIKTLMKSLGYTCESYGKYNHDVYSNPSGVTFEIHRSLVYQPQYPELYAYFENIKDRLVKDENKRFGFHMTNEDFYIFQICHLYKHYKQSGTGLRSLLDVYVFNKKFGKGIDRLYLNKELKKLNLNDFESEVRHLSEKAFSLQGLSDNEKAELVYYFESNTHGTMEHSIMRRLDNNDSGKAKRKYVLKRLFPTNEVLKKQYPFTSICIFFGIHIV